MSDDQRNINHVTLQTYIFLQLFKAHIFIPNQVFNIANQNFDIIAIHSSYVYIFSIQLPLCISRL